MAAPFAGATAVLSCLLALATLASCNTEGDILYGQRQSWKDPNDVLQSWDPTLVNPCTWLHITCNNNNSVIRVDLPNAGLSGTLVPDLGGLKNLEYLILYGNNLTGPIPESFGNLTSLEGLELQKNALSGAIPSSREHQNIAVPEAERKYADGHGSIGSPLSCHCWESDRAKYCKQRLGWNSQIIWFESDYNHPRQAEDYMMSPWIRTLAFLMHMLARHKKINPVTWIDLDIL